MIGVSIIDDNQELREYYATVLRGTPNFECASAYEDCETALQHIAGDQPEVILLDIEFPEHCMSGIEGARRLKKLLPETQIIMMTHYADAKHVFPALKNGATGYLVKRVPPAELLDAIKTIHAGGSPMSMAIARMVTESFRRDQRFDDLTERQREALDKLCEGKSYKAIAQELHLSVHAIKFHIRNIYQILHVSNKAEAVSVVMRKK